MIKKDFHSKLFKRTIKKEEEDYEAKVKAELLHRIKELERNHCSCMRCTFELEKYNTYYNKLNPPRPKFVG